ncbi:hypothetical protein [Nostocoides japonicum]|nr:hypothetical protein [Tetrasphaera japonica]
MTKVTGMTREVNIMRRLGIASALLAAALVLIPGTAAMASSCRDSVSIVAQPTTTQRDTAMTPAVVVQVEDRRGHVDTRFNGSVTLGYAEDPGGAPPPANNTVRAVRGVATFPALTFSSVGFGFALTASIQGATSAPSQAFDIVDQLVLCSAGQTCSTGVVASDGTSGSAVGAASSSSGVLLATGGGFPALSCTTRGGVLTFTSDRALRITVSIPATGGHRGPGPVDVCWGDDDPFVTASGAPAAFNPANGDYEGLLPGCRPCPTQPCVLSRNRGHHEDTAVVYAPAGDPHITF